MDTYMDTRMSAKKPMGIKPIPQIDAVISQIAKDDLKFSAITTAPEHFNRTY